MHRAIAEPSGPLRVLLAPDKFKGSLTASEVAAALEAGLTSAQPSIRTELAPVADGGDGTVAAALRAGFERVPLLAEGPTGLVDDACYGRRDETAIIELASICGMGRLPAGKLEPWRSSSYGLGQAVNHALSNGATTIIVGVGGSASTDGGAGFVQALGAELRGVSGRATTASLEAVSDVVLDVARARLDGVQLVLATDVDLPLLGANGAAATFAPQKGASHADVTRMDMNLRRWAKLLAPADAGLGGTGAGGGVGLAVIALGGRIVDGASLILDLLDFDTRLASANLVLTGEGSLDAQTLTGKAPLRVAQRAKAAGVPVIAVVGSCSLDSEQLRIAGITGVYALSDREPDLQRSMRHAAALIQDVGRQIAQTALRARGRRADPE